MLFVKIFQCFISFLAGWCFSFANILQNLCIFTVALYRATEHLQVAFLLLCNIALLITNNIIIGIHYSFYAKYSDWPSITQSQTYGSRESIHTCYSSTSIITNSMALRVVAVMTCVSSWLYTALRMLPIRLNHIIFVLRLHDGVQFSCWISERWTVDRPIQQMESLVLNQPIFLIPLLIY